MSHYTTHQAFNDLFFDFTGHTHSNYPSNQRSIAQDLAKVVSQQLNSAEQGPLVIANSVGIYVYSGEAGHKLISSAEYRAAPNSGFYELTSISHVGPAIAYLGALQKYGDLAWEDHIEPMIEHLSVIKKINSAAMDDHWLTKLQCYAWLGKESQIKNMIDYACSLAGNYLVNVRKHKDVFCSKHLIENFLEVQTKAYPIPYNTIMIATFALVGLKSLSDIYFALNHRNINWETAKVILHNLAGTNYGAGMTAGSNWLHGAIQSITKLKLDPKRILIMPYASLPENLGNDRLTDTEFDRLATIWGSIFSRPLVAEAAFPHIQDIFIPHRTPIPGDYEITSAEQIDHFIMRLKFSTGNIKEMLSNTVGFWLAGEAVDKQWQIHSMAIPGLTHGLPAGISKYPDHSPDIQH
ncbi:DUF5624 domain-containing protein [Legionella nagasakiensis]|uniref:DUF5624 domain-containing protein n=1 Tax=Legionella nagasakiensis TaxID=535290 RepID=UPI001056AEF1|nr:DUF5624 domain-containing protein [Legionella nagasakiensis]